MSDYIYANGELYHYGVKGMKWGVRRYQNKDGSLTPAGQKHQRKLEKRKESYEFKTKRKAHDNKQNADRERRHLKALEIEGMDSERVKTRSKEIARRQIDSKYDRIDSLWSTTTSDKERDFAFEFAYALGSREYKQMAYKELVKEHNSSIKRYESQAKKWMAANEAVMNMPIESTKKEYRQAIRRAKLLVD